MKDSLLSPEQVLWSRAGESAFDSCIKNRNEPGMNRAKPECGDISQISFQSPRAHLKLMINHRHSFLKCQSMYRNVLFHKQIKLTALQQLRNRPKKRKPDDVEQIIIVLCGERHDVVQFSASQLVSQQPINVSQVCSDTGSSEKQCFQIYKYAQMVTVLRPVHTKNN